MRSIGLIASLAAVAVSAPLAAQRNRLRTDDVLQSARIPSSVQEESRRGSDKIPPGHRPPAGMCRVWIDGVPPGRQPAPTNCQTAVATKPANARVIWGDQSTFPGKGKSKAGNGQQTGQNRTGRGRDDDDVNDDRDDDDRNDRRAGARTTQGPTTTRNDDNESHGRSEKSLKSKSNKGKGHGDD